MLARFGGALSIGAHNGPTTTVVSGERSALEAFREAARRRGIFCAAVKIDYAPHSRETDPVLDEVEALLRPIRPRRATVPVVSTVTGAALTGPECDPSYWVRNLREPVLFSSALAGLVVEGPGAFVEISAHPVLAGSVRALSPDGGVIASLRRGEPGRASML